MKRKPSLNEARWTPGPWVGFADGGKLAAIMPAGRAGDICTFETPPSEPDGRLMIAAPDLVVALSILLDLAREHIHPRDMLIAESAAELALAKARGA